MLNPFANDAFSVVNLTKAIQLLPIQYGRTAELGIFPERGVTSRQVLVEEMNGVLTLLQTQPPGSPGPADRRAKRKVRSFTIPHIPLEGELLPEEYSGIRDFGTENALLALAKVLNDKLARMRAKHLITHEHLRMGALKGHILDADGSVIYDLFTEFGIAQNQADFTFGTANADLTTAVRNVNRKVEDNLLGDVSSGVRALVSPGFFDELITHPSVKQAYLNYAAAAQMIGGDVRKGFTFGGVTFEEYRGQAVDSGGTVRKFIPDNEGIAYPEGAQSTFEMLHAPADFLETVNTPGEQIYAKQEPREFNRGIKIHTQSNPLPICYRPGCLVRLFSSN